MARRIVYVAHGSFVHVGDDAAVCVVIAITAATDQHGRGLPQTLSACAAGIVIVCGAAHSILFSDVADKKVHTVIFSAIVAAYG